MYFKKILASVCLFNLAACAWVQDKPQQKKISTQKMDMTCLETMPIKLNKLFEGRMTADSGAEVDGIWSCIDTTLASFATYTRGQNTDRYEVQELQDFANRYLPKNQKVSSNFMRGIFKMKASFVGGSLSHITKAEIADFRIFIKKFGAAVGPLAPHIFTLLKHTGNTNQLERMAASLALENFVADLTNVLKVSPNDLAWADLNLFLTELNQFLSMTANRRPNSNNALTFICEQFDLFRSLKLLFVGGSDTVIEKNKWEFILKDIAKGYTALLFAADSADLLERLDITVTSTEQDRIRATSQITDTLARLVQLDSLQNHAGIQNLADHWAKALIASHAFFPRSNGALEVKIFLDSKKLRGLFASAIVRFQKLKLETDQMSDTAADHIGALADIGMDVVTEMNARAGGTDRVPVSTNIPPLRAKILALKPLLKDPNEANFILDAVQIALTIRPFFSSRVGETFYITEWNALLQKGFGIYKTLKRQNGKVWTPKDFSEIAETLLTSNVGRSLSKTNIDDSYPALIRILDRLKVDTSIVSTIQKNVDAAFEGKTILFGTDPNTITLAEMQQVQLLLHTFSDSGRTWTDRFQQMAIDLSVVGIREFQIKSLLDWANARFTKPVPLDDFHLNVETLGMLKTLVLGGDSKTMTSGDLKSICLLAASLSTQFPDLKVPGLDDAGLNSKLFDSLSRALTAVAQFHQRDIVRTRSDYSGMELNQLLKFATNYQKAVGYNISDASLNRLLRGLYHRGFEPNRNPIPATMTGSLTAKHLNVLADRFKRAAELYRGLETLTNSDALSTTDRYKLKTQTVVLKSRLPLLSTANQAFFEKLIKSYPPQLDGETKAIQFPKKGERLTAYSYYDLAFKTLLVTFSEWLTPGYQLEKPIQTQVLDYVSTSDRMKWTINDLAGFLEDTGGLLKDLGISYATLPPLEIAKKQMTAANLFMASSNGDDEMTFNEAVEYINVNAATKPVFDSLWVDIKTSCSNIGTEDSPLYAAKCVESSLFNLNNVDRWYGLNLPQWVQRMKDLNAEELKEFQEGYLKSARAGIDRKRPWDRYDLQTLIAIPHYIESAYIKFDQNLNGQMEFKEAMKAFPTFCNEIKKASDLPGSCDPDYDPGQVEALYGYLLFYGTTPDATGSIWHKIRVGIHWLNFRRFWNRLDRSDAVRDVYGPFLKRDGLIQILSNLAETSTTSASFVSRPTADVRPESR